MRSAILCVLALVGSCSAFNVAAPRAAVAAPRATTPVAAIWDFGTANVAPATDKGIKLPIGGYLNAKVETGMYGVKKVPNEGYSADFGGILVALSMPAILAAAAYAVYAS